MITKDFNVCLAVMPEHGGEASDSQDRRAEQHSLTPALQGASQQLITNTIFCLANKREILWMHSQSEQWHLTDNQQCLCVDLCLSANDHNWKHSEFLGTTRLRAHSKCLLNIKKENSPGFSDYNDP